MSDFWLRKMRTYFQRIDFDKDGAITRKDFEQMADRVIATGELKPEQQEDLKKTLTAVWDKYLSTVGGGESIGKEPFINSMKVLVKEPSLKATLEGPLPLFFHAVDADNDKFIDIQEFKRFFQMMNMHEKLAVETFNAIDDNQDGKISLEEFMHNGAEFFLEETDESKPSKLFWGPIDT